MQTITSIQLLRQCVDANRYIQYAISRRDKLKAGFFLFSVHCFIIIDRLKDVGFDGVCNEMTHART